MSAPREFTLDDGRTITAGRLAFMAGISHAAARGRLGNSDNLQELLNGSVPGERVYRRDSDEAYTATDVQQLAGLKRTTAVTRCRRWEDGEITTAELLHIGRMPNERKKPVAANCRNKGSAEWRALGKKERDHMLRRIPGATPWERKTWRVDR